jgi:hypothetical protein
VLKHTLYSYSERFAAAAASVGQTTATWGQIAAARQAPHAAHLLHFSRIRSPEQTPVGEGLRVARRGRHAF